MIIEHFTDQDTYKISMQQFAWHQYPKAVGRYDLTVRTKNPKVPMADLAGEIRDEINSFENLALTNDEYVHIQRTMPWIKTDYLDWLATFRYCPDLEAKIGPTKDGGLSASFCGPQWHCGMPYEVPALAVIEEVYCHRAYGLTPEEAERIAIERLIPKIAMLKAHPQLKFTDFGTRRAFSRRVHKAVVKYAAANCPNLIGTSNLWLSKECGLKPIGTMAHEVIMAHLALVDRLEMAQKRALYVWQQEFGKSLGTALSDTFTTEAFWRDFDAVLSSVYDSVRQDSGNPFKFALDAIAHYRNMGIDPRTKSIIFSDNLTFELMIELFEAFIGLIGVGFGIGTNFANDLGFEPLSIVIKLMELNGVPLVKLGDSVGAGCKIMGEPKMVDKVIDAFRVRRQS